MKELRLKFQTDYMCSFVWNFLSMHREYLLIWVGETLIHNCSWCSYYGAYLNFFLWKATKFSFTSEKKRFWNLCCSKAGLLSSGEIWSVHSCSSGAQCFLLFPLEAAQMLVLGASCPLEFISSSSFSCSLLLSFNIISIGSTAKQVMGFLSGKISDS